MKKILLILSLMALATTAGAQFVVSAQLGGSYAFGSTTPDATFTGRSQLTGNDTVYAVPVDTITHDNPMYLTAGFKIGYQVGRLQVGLAAGLTVGLSRRPRRCPTAQAAARTKAAGW